MTKSEYRSIYYEHLRAECSVYANYGVPTLPEQGPQAGTHNQQEHFPASFFLLSEARTPSIHLMKDWYCREIINCGGTGLAYHSAPLWLHSGQTYPADVTLTASKDWVPGFPINPGSTQAEHFLGLVHPCQQINYLWKVKCRFPLGWHFGTSNFWIMVERRLKNIGKTSSARTCSRRKEAEGNDLSKHMALPTLFRAVPPPSGI